MSVDSIYFLADYDQAQRMWRQPLSATLKVAQEWTPPGERSLGLLHTKGVETVVKPLPRQLAEENGSDTSLYELGIAAAEPLHELSAAPKRGIFGRGRAWSKALERALPEAVSLASLHSSVIEFNRKGPVTELGNTRATDGFFPHFLLRFMPEEESSKYVGSDKRNLLGPAIPPGFNPLLEEVMCKLELRANPPYHVDAQSWLARWQRLEEIPGLWDALAEDGMRQVDINHIKGVGDLCR